MLTIFGCLTDYVFDCHVDYLRLPHWLRLWLPCWLSSAASLTTSLTAMLTIFGCLTDYVIDCHVDYLRLPHWLRHWLPCWLSSAASLTTSLTAFASVTKPYLLKLLLLFFHLVLFTQEQHCTCACFWCNPSMKWSNVVNTKYCVLLSAFESIQRGKQWWWTDHRSIALQRYESTYHIVLFTHQCPAEIGSL